jgi:protein-S-isoprenylcysteine O-methyltransferase Ste14
MDMRLALAIFVAITVIGRYFSQGPRKNKMPKQARPWKSMVRDSTAIISALAAGIAMGLAVLEAALGGNTRLSIVRVLFGTVIMIIGWVIAYFANREIGANWSPIIEKTPRQQLVTSGIYRHVRHPLYLSGLLILAGTNLYFSCQWAWFGLLMVLVPILYRLPLEERELKERYGDEYISYMRKTKAIIPRIF